MCVCGVDRNIHYLFCFFYLRISCDDVCHCCVYTNIRVYFIFIAMYDLEYVKYSAAARSDFKNLT